MKCKWHLCDKKLTGRQTVFCSVNCKNKYNVTLRRRKVKSTLIEEMGGVCERCGWHEHPAGLQFHHPDPKQKEFALSANGSTRGIDAQRAEADKCHLLCSNCHAVVHAIADSDYIYTRQAFSKVE